MPHLNGGTFNLRYGRDPERVKREVARLFAKHELHFLAVQEFSDYRDAFRDAGWTVIPERGPCESGLIVANGVKIDDRHQHVYGDGWITVRGGNFPAAVHNEARLGGWLRVRSVHLPTPTFWGRTGALMAPAERADDLRATMRGLWRFLSHPGFVNARLVAGDWNEPPRTVGRWTPRWLARTTGGRIAVPGSLEGHGRIDYVIAKGARIRGLHGRPTIFKDTLIPELSDHEPVIFRVVKGRG